MVAAEAPAGASFSDLHKCELKGDYDKALKICNKILQATPDDAKALHCKAVCMIQLSNFKDALKLIDDPKHSAAASNLHFEKAYSQYRLNALKDSLETIESAPEATPALKELRAQVLYRLEKYNDCFALYREIVKHTSDEYEEERQTNMSAVFAYLAENETSGSQPWTGLSKYEVVYNVACREALQNKFPESLKLLNKAETLAADDNEEDDLAEETAIIKVQKAYCLQMQGKDKEAATIYQEVLKNKPSDQALGAIANNNLVVMNKEVNVFDSRKRMKVATQDGLEHKLTSRQKRTILYNQALLAVYSNQNEHCRQLCVKLVKQFSMDKEAILIEASCLFKDGKHSQAIDLLLKHANLKLAAVQMILSQGDRKQAIKLLESSELKYKPGVIGTLVTLYLADNNRDAVTELFKESMNHLKRVEERKSVEEAWRSRHGGPGSLLSIRSLVHLALATAGTDPDKAFALIADHTQLKNVEEEVDVDSLETSNWMMGAKVVKKSSRPEQQSPGTPKTEKKKKKKRKTKLPANVDLSIPPDPERWLPRYERTAFRKRRQRGNRDVIKGSQGMTTSATDQYDMTKQQPGQGKSPRVVEKQSTPSEPGWQKNKQQKKKRKGGKW